jgi:hypothetical protein
VKCRNEGKECVYGEGKREREKRELRGTRTENRELARRCEELWDGLVRIGEEVAVDGGGGLKTRVEGVLRKFGIDDRSADKRQDDASDNHHDEDDDDGDDDEEEDQGSDIGSMGSLDIIQEDTNKDAATRKAGYMGKGSAVRWFQSANRRLDIPKGASGAGEAKKTRRGEIGNTAKEVNYFASDADFQEIDLDMVNPLELPPPPTANALIDCHFARIHPLFPMLPQQWFRAKFRRYMAQEPPQDLAKVSEEERGWLCLLNLVFAIATRYSQVAQPDYLGDARNHLLYFGRSQILGLDVLTLHKDSELQQTTLVGLLGIYFLITEQTSR